jgi:aryl-alcohol dehydrogenase-like predicted oxidoreductase
MKNYMNERGFAVLAALDEIAAAHRAHPSEIALAWVMAKPGVTAPIASATSLDQLDSLARAAKVTLSDEDIAKLDRTGP